MGPTLLLIVIIGLQQTAICRVNFKDQAVHSSVIQNGGNRAERAEAFTLESHFFLLYLYIQGQVTSIIKALIYSPVK